MLFFFVALAAIALDQYSKYLIIHRLELGQAIPYGFFDIRHVHNFGAAFGMLQNAGYLFVAIAVIVLGGMIVSMPRIQRAEKPIVIALALIAGGTIGNLIDRLRFGYVVDFFDLRWWPVFNVADSCICVGVGLLVWKIFQQSHEDETPVAQSELSAATLGLAEPNNTPVPPA